MSYIDVQHNTKRYRNGRVKVLGNDDVSFKIEKGELAIVLGGPGAGKSTLLNILGGMDTNTSGEVIVDGKNITKYSKRQLAAYRQREVGFVFQYYNLAPNLTAKENVELASELVDVAQDATEVLTEVGLGDQVNSFPAQLSGGEKQCVAIARAVAKNPKLLLCDEPTSALDFKAGRRALQVIQNMTYKRGATVVIVTHNTALVPIADRVIHMKDGKVLRVDHNEHPEEISTIEW